MTVERDSELKKWMDEAEFHAFSVRQLIGQRSRLFEAFKVAAKVARFDDEIGPRSPALGVRVGNELRESRLAKVLQNIEQSSSQFLQDIYCLLLSRGKEAGFFVEFGACDGLLINNTVLMERQFGWRGILSEPAPRWAEALKQNRECIIDTRCVWSKTGDFVEFSEFSDDEYHTQSTVTAAAAGDNPTSATYKVETVSLYDLLREHNAPNYIDFISIDTEGTEYEILSAFPFDKYRFGFICVEHHTATEEERLKDLFQKAGYRQILRSVSGHDGYYIDSSNEVDL